MSSQPVLTPRLGKAAAVIMLVVAAVFVLVVASQLFVSGPDPRESLGARAAGFGFSDRARNTLFGAFPLALPALAAFATGCRKVRWCAVFINLVMVLLAVLIAAAAFSFGIDLAGQQSQEGVSAWITPYAAVELLFVDAGFVVLAGCGLAVTVVALRRSGPSVAP